MTYQKRFIGDPDQHIQETPDFWTSRVPARYKEYAPRIVPFPLGGECFIFDGGEYFWPLGLEVAAGKNYAEYKWHGSRFEEIRPGFYDPKERLVDMAIDGIDAAALFPSTGMRMRSPRALQDHDFGLALVRAYNHGMWEFCSEDFNRLIPLAVIPGFGVESAIAELEFALNQGFRSIFLSALPNGGDQPEPEDDAFWARCEEAGVIVNIHQALAHGNEVGGMASAAEFWEPDRAMRLMNRAARNVVAGRSGVRIIKDLSALALTGVFERFPGLKVVSVETGVGWIPFFLEQLDDNWKRHRFWADAPVLRMLPSEYIRRNVWATFQIDRAGVKARHDIGLDRIMWSTDYPHTGQDWPNSRFAMELEMTDVPEDEKRTMIGGTMAELYGLDPGAFR